jgi:diguanylate cyclase (GGDEF)-like protein
MPKSHEDRWISATPCSISGLADQAGKDERAHPLHSIVLQLTVAVVAFAGVMGLVFWPDRLVTHNARFWPQFWPQCWLGPGLLTGILLLSPRHRWPWCCALYFLACGVAQQATGYASLPSLGVTTITVVESLIIAVVLSGRHDWIAGASDGLSDWLRFIGSTMLIVPAGAALQAAVVVSGESSLSYFDTMLGWYIAHATSLCVITPLLLRFRSPQLARLRDRRRLGEAIVWGAIFLVTACAIFSQQDALPLFLLMPLLVIILVRTGFAGLTLSIAVLALLAAIMIPTGRGPFEAMMLAALGPGSLAQLFILLLFTMAAAIAALLYEGRAREEALEKLNVELAYSAATCPLTDVPNRRAYDVAVASAWRIARARQSSLALLMIDLDHFKQYNDRYGHAAGDRCLQQVAEALRGTLRNTDSFYARYGGEEFVVLLPGVTAQDAYRIGARICSIVRNLGLQHIDNPNGIVTVSVGAAATVPGENDASGLFQRSDEALYQAKASGRNRVEHA